MGLDYQLHRVGVDIAKGYRQVQKAGAAFAKGDTNSGVGHLDKAWIDFDAAVKHAAKAEEDAYNKAGQEIDKGNAELKKSIEAYSDGHDERAASHYDSATEHFDRALDLID